MANEVVVAKADGDFSALITDTVNARDAAQAAESGAVSARETAEGYRDDAESARSDAQSFRTQAVNAKTDAEDAESGALAAQTAAQAFRDDAEAAKDKAQRLVNNGLSTVNAANYVESTADGGEAIQAAINDLSEKGGIVFVPADGPDDGVLNGKANIENDVWEVNTPINFGERKGVHIIGEGAAAQQVEDEPSGITGGGTAIVAGSSIDHVMFCKYPQGSGLWNLRLSGGNPDGTNAPPNGATHNIIIGDGQNVDGDENYFYIDRCSFQEAFVNILYRGFNACFISNSIIVDGTGETELGAGFRVLSGIGTFFFTNTFFLNNDIGIDFTGTPFLEEYSNAQITNCKIDGAAVSTYGIRVDENITQLKVTNVDSFNLGSSFLRIEDGSTLSRSSIAQVTLNGSDETDYVIDNRGSIQDVSVRDMYAKALNFDKYNNVVDDIQNTTRVQIDGLGYNGSSDPSTGGDWNGSGEEGLRVLWDNGGAPTLAEYVSGAWYSRAL